MANAFTGTATAGDVVGIPANVLTVHTNDLILAAMPVMRYDQFAVVRTDLTKNPGDTISFSKYSNLTRGGTLNEEDALESLSMSATKITISVTEYGNAVGLTAKFMTLSFMDEMNNASILLGRDYAIVTDAMLRDALYGGTQKQMANGRANVWSIVAGDTLSLEDIDQTVETLSTANVLRYVDANGEFYAGYLHPHHARPIRKSMISIRQYAYPELIFKGEIGEYNGVRWIETTNCPNGAADSGDVSYDATLILGYDNGSSNLNQVALYECVVFGRLGYCSAC
jgi:N4-gp56 family major capsid protein